MTRVLAIAVAALVAGSAAVAMPATAAPPLRITSFRVLKAGGRTPISGALHAVVGQL